MKEAKPRYKYDHKMYLHFDGRRYFNLKTENYVNNPKMINTHRFYPLIRYKIKNEKYKKYDRKLADVVKYRPVKTSNRTIMYASHIDNFIYKHYASTLNKEYNRWVKENKVDEHVTAYRSKEGESGKSNIDFAAEVIHQICMFDSCYILIGDFEGYFDSLKHQQLKEHLCEILGVTSLSEDWFKVFNSITKYSYYNKRLLNKFCGSDKKLRRSNQNKYFKSPREFRKFKKLYPIQTNTNAYGIPQGTAISALLSNVYAIHFDVAMKQLIEEYGGLYRRYSDDFIIVLPDQSQEAGNHFEFVKQKIDLLIGENQLKIKEEKTESYYYNQGTITNVINHERDKVDYLGFVFDGENVEMRDKSPNKFYRNAYKLIRKAQRVKEKKNLKKIPYRKKLNRLYTDVGINRGSYGNFITYAKKSQDTFDQASPLTNNLMMQQLKNRKKNIERMLGYQINTKID